MCLSLITAGHDRQMLRGDKINKSSLLRPGFLQDILSISNYEEKQRHGKCDAQKNIGDQMETKWPSPVPLEGLDERKI